MSKLHYEHTDGHSYYAGIFTKDFKVGETITWLGHDGVYGYWYDQNFRCEQEHFDKRMDFPVYKRIGTIHLSELDSNMNPKPIRTTTKKCKHHFELDGGQCIKCGKTVIEIWDDEPSEILKKPRRTGKTWLRYFLNVFIKHEKSINN